MRRIGREYAYAVTSSLMGIPAFVLALLGLVFSALSLLTIGLPFLIGVLWLARRCVGYFRRPARALLGWDWPRPVPLRPTGPLRLVRDRTAWKALAYSLLSFPVKLSGAYVGAALVLLGLAFATYPAWWWAAPTAFDALDPVPWTGTWWPALQGLAALLVFPWFVRLLVLLDRLLAYALLAPSPDQHRIAALEEARTALQSDAIALLRRVERDLHDGPQARLVALGLTLSRVERHTDDPQARQLLQQARVGVTDALSELRDIVRGMHPPALDDGLEVALTTLAGRSAVPVTLTIDLDTPPPTALASAIYFTVAELLTNIARHASATRARVDLQAHEQWVRLAVHDDGGGGADPHAPGTGLSGLARRAAALDGTFVVTSPAGGPTAITVSWPK
jgi:signal transduction histidine kinase